MQSKFRADLGERSFGVAESEGKKASAESRSPATALDVLKWKELREMIDELINKAIKAGKAGQ